MEEQLNQLLQRINALTGKLALIDTALSAECAAVGDDLISLLKTPENEPPIETPEMPIGIEQQ